MDDLVKRLRERKELFCGGPALVNPDGPEAADAIETLTRERDEARAKRDDAVRFANLVIGDFHDLNEAVKVNAARATALEREVERLNGEVKRLLGMPAQCPENDWGGFRAVSQLDAAIIRGMANAYHPTEAEIDAAAFRPQYHRAPGLFERIRKRLFTVTKEAP